MGSQDAAEGQWRGGGPHHISVVARERAVAQRGWAFVVPDGAAILSRERIAPRQRNAADDRKERAGWREEVRSSQDGARGGGASEGRTILARLLERVQPLSVVVPSQFMMAPPSCRGGGLRRVSATVWGGTGGRAGRWGSSQDAAWGRGAADGRT